ncbi:MAG: radical SAM protein [Myxococcota bacterium]
MKDFERRLMTQNAVSDHTAQMSLAQAEHIELHLGQFCNNRCVFCVSGQLTEQGRAAPVSTDELLARLDEAAASGVRGVTLLGGEPTLHPDFLTVLDRVVALGFAQIVLFTNGARGRQAAFLDAVMARGPITWRFSIQGSDAATHDAVTRRPGSFARIMAALAHLSSHDADITVNLCVNARSYASLPGYPALVAQYGIRQLHVDVVRPKHTGVRSDEYLRDIMPRYTEMVPAFREMLAKFDALGARCEVHVGNLPLCLMPERADQIHHGGRPTVNITPDLSGEWKALQSKYAVQFSDATYAPGCDGCVFRPQCRGVPAKYAAFYGVDELSPLTIEQLRDCDPHQRSFALTELRTLSALLDHPPPRSWMLRSLAPHPRDHQIVLTAEGPDGATAQITFAARHVNGSLSVITDRMVVFVHCTVPGDQVRWVRWSMGALRAQCPTIQGIRCVDPMLWERAKRQALQTARRLRAASLGAFRHTRTLRMANHAGLRVDFGAADGQTLTIRIRYQPDGTLQLSFDAAQPPTAAVRSAIRQANRVVSSQSRDTRPSA